MHVSDVVCTRCVLLESLSLLSLHLMNDVSFRFAAVWRAFGHPVFYAAPARPHDTPFFGPTTEFDGIVERFSQGCRRHCSSGELAAVTSAASTKVSSAQKERKAPHRKSSHDNRQKHFRRSRFPKGTESFQRQTEFVVFARPETLPGLSFCSRTSRRSKKD